MAGASHRRSAARWLVSHTLPVCFAEASRGAELARPRGSHTLCPTWARLSSGPWKKGGSAGCASRRHDRSDAAPESDRRARLSDALRCLERETVAPSFLRPRISPRRRRHFTRLEPPPRRALDPMRRLACDLRSSASRRRWVHESSCTSAALTACVASTTPRKQGLRRNTGSAAPGRADDPSPQLRLPCGRHRALHSAGPCETRASAHARQPCASARRLARLASRRVTPAPADLQTELALHRSCSPAHAAEAAAAHTAGRERASFSATALAVS